MTIIYPRAMTKRAERATTMLKALGHEGRLMILCHLTHGERTVGELEQLLSWRQPAVSQHLARLRTDRLIKARRSGREIYYRISDHRVRHLLEALYDAYCGGGRQ